MVFWGWGRGVFRRSYILYVQSTLNSIQINQQIIYIPADMRRVSCHAAVLAIVFSSSDTVTVSTNESSYDIVVEQAVAHSFDNRAGDWFLVLNKRSIV